MAILWQNIDSNNTNVTSYSDTTLGILLENYGIGADSDCYQSYLFAKVTTIFLELIFWISEE